VDPIRTSFVAGRLDNAPGRVAADRDRLPGVLVGVVALLDLGIERVHVNVEDTTGLFLFLARATSGALSARCLCHVGVLGPAHGN
jgi:hypothetical protein